MLDGNVCGGMALMPLPEAARRLGISVWTLRAHQKQGTLQVRRIGRRVMLPCDELLRVAREGLPSLMAGAERAGNVSTAL